MFTDFLYALREQRVPVGLGEWLALHEALGKGLIEGLDDLYGLGRALLVHTEGHYDAYDVAFAATFQGITDEGLHDALMQWLENPIDPVDLSPEEFEKLTGMSLDELRKRFQETLAKQKERHDGGNRWVGTGGSSPFGSGGQHPTGIRVGQGGGRSAVQIAEERRFRNYRTDAVLDVRQFKQALKMLRSLSREGPELLDQAIVHRRKERVHVREVAKHRPNAHVGLCGDLLGGRLQVAVPDEIQQRLNDRLAASLGSLDASIRRVVCCGRHVPIMAYSMP